MQDKGKLQQAFEKFHGDNPIVYEWYKRFAYQALDAGMEKLSISLLTERVRWEAQVVTKSDDPFKINNNHRAFYARKLNDEPMLRDMFRTRAQSVHYH